MHINRKEISQDTEFKVGTSIFNDTMNFQLGAPNERKKEGGKKTK